MADAQDPRINVVRAVGAMQVGIAIIDNAPEACPLCAKVRAHLVDRLEGRIQLDEQTCPRGVHRTWWADTDDTTNVLDCPWCEIDDLKARLEQCTAGVS